MNLFNSITANKALCTKVNRAYEIKDIAAKAGHNDLATKADNFINEFGYVCETDDED